MELGAGAGRQQEMAVVLHEVRVVLGRPAHE